MNLSTVFLSNQTIRKFIKGFLTGGLTGVSAVLLLGVQIKTLEDLKSVLVLVAVAFIGGAIHGLTEMLKPTLPATVTSSVTTQIGSTAPQTTTVTTP